MAKRTYESIGKEIGLTKSAVRKIEQKALRKAEEILAKHGYTLEDLFPPEKQQRDIAEGLTKAKKSEY